MTIEACMLSRRGGANWINAVSELCKKVTRGAISCAPRRPATKCPHTSDDPPQNRCIQFHFTLNACHHVLKKFVIGRIRASYGLKYRIRICWYQKKIEKPTMMLNGGKSGDERKCRRVAVVVVVSKVVDRCRQVPGI